MRKLYSIIIICISLLLGNSKDAKAQDLGAPTYSTLTWDQIASANSIAYSIGLTTDHKMYVWGTNAYYAIHTKSNGNRPLYQTTPYYLPSPAGDTIVKVGITSQFRRTALPTTTDNLPMFACLSKGGKLYTWGFNDGLSGTTAANPSFPVNDGSVFTVPSTDTTKAKRRPIQLSILGESSFVDFSLPENYDYWIVIGASGNAYHIGRNSSDLGTYTTAFTALPKPAGTTATFKYTKVWASNMNPSTAFLKGNDGNIYYWGANNNVNCSGVPGIYTDLAASIKPSPLVYQNLQTVAPLLVPFPPGEDIIKMVPANNIDQRYGISYALSASGKAYSAGFWKYARLENRSTNPKQYGNKYAAYPLKTYPSSGNIIGAFTQPVSSTSGDSTYTLSTFQELALPLGANKIIEVLDMSASGGTGYKNSASQIITDQNKVYFSGVSKLYSTAGYMGNPLGFSETDPTNSYPATNTECYSNENFVAGSPTAWIVESIMLRGAAKIVQSTGLSEAAIQQAFIISNSGRGYFWGVFDYNAGLGKIFNAARGGGYLNYPVPIGNELLDVCNTSQGPGGTWSAGPAAPTNTAVGTIDCAKTQLSPAPTVGTATQLDLIVSINVSTAGTFTPITVSGSGMTVANDINSVTTATTGIQTFHIPMKYDGTALGSLNFTIGSAGGCTADLGTITKKKVINEIWSLDNCTVQTVAPDLK